MERRGRSRARARIGSRALAVAIAGAVWVVALPAVAWAEAPGNDDFDAAIPATEIPFAHVGFNTEATRAEDDPDCFSGQRTTWYSFTPIENIRVDAVTAGSNHDTTLGVYTGTRGALTEVGCNDDTIVDKRSRVRFDAVAGTTYFIMAASLGQGTRGTLKFSLIEAPGPPKNDNVDKATVIERLPFSVTQDVQEATAADSDDDCFGTGHTVWFKFTPEKDQKLHASTAGSYFDTTLVIYQRKRGELELLACVDDFKRSSRAEAKFDAKENKTYVFRIGSSGDSVAGQLRFSVAEVPPPLRLKLSIAASGSANDVTGQAIISGVVRCARLTTVTLSGTLRQRQGNFVARGGFRKQFRCEGKKAWNAKVDAGKRAFVAGSVGVTVTAQAERVKRERSAVVSLI